MPSGHAGFFCKTALAWTHVRKPARIGGQLLRDRTAREVRGSAHELYHIQLCIEVGFRKQSTHA
jgi:hypothetical protein